MFAKQIVLADGSICFPLTGAVEKLRRSMSGNRPSVEKWPGENGRPDLKVYVKQRFDESERRLAQAISRRELQVYALNSSSEGHIHPLLPIPSSVVSSLRAVEGGLADSLGSLRIRLYLEVQKALNFPAHQAVLVLLKEDFDAWLRKERHKKIWPSQHQQKRRGRPSTIPAVQKVIRALERERQWTPLQPFKVLVSLVRRRLRKPISEATVRRALKELYRLTRSANFNASGGIRQRTNRMRQAWEDLS